MSEARLWGGTTLADRRAVRREKLIAAGLELLGGEDPSAMSVRAACRTAQLTERYFYESFADRDAWVLAVYDSVAAEVQEVLTRATAGARDSTEVARAAVEAMVGLAVDDPRKGRVLLTVPLTEPKLAAKGLQLVPVIAGMIRDQLSPTASDTDRDLIAVGFVGALMSLFHAYLAGTVQVAREEFVEHCVRLLMNARRLERRPPPAL